jgi:hypothetical protein
MIPVFVIISLLFLFLGKVHSNRFTSAFVLLLGLILSS